MSEQERCSDCPPVGYPTDNTRCSSCDRSAVEQLTRAFGEAEASKIMSEYHHNSEWQTIDSAPKDGTKVLVGCFRTAAGFSQFHGHMDVDRWEERFRGFGKFNEFYWPATHWQPLPPPPSKAKQVEKDQ